jgi:hypothetical protein
MKYLKTINELFDDEKTRSKFGEDYLRGDLSPEDTLEWDEYTFDGLLNKILEKVRYLNSFSNRKLGSMLEFTFEENRDGLNLLFNIEITRFESGSFMLKVISYSFIDEKEDWSESDRKMFNDIESLINYLNNEVLKSLERFSKYSSQYGVTIIKPNNMKYDMN